MLQGPPGGTSDPDSRHSCDPEHTYFPLLLLPRAIVSATLKPSQWCSRKLQSSEAAHPSGFPSVSVGKGGPRHPRVSFQKHGGWQNQDPNAAGRSPAVFICEKSRPIHRGPFLFTNFQSSREAVREDEGARTPLLHRGGGV